jgi:carbonic anhydrase-like protein
MIRPLPNSPFAADESAIEISHQLPMAAYHAAERWHPERIGALALYCSDGRWGEAFDEFCHRHLQIPRYDRWAVPGGPAWINAPQGTDYLKATRIQLDFLVRAHELERIVLITHFGCAWYGHLLKKPAEECLPDQTKDVQKAATLLQGWYPGLTVEAYLAMRTRDWLSFHRIEVHNGARSW